MRNTQPKKRRAAGETPQVVVRLPRPLLERIERLSDEAFCTRSNAIRMLLERGLRQSQAN
jgi:metal-responsive CopG/Arc/MetJ family transcriptional regulator